MQYSFVFSRRRQKDLQLSSSGHWSGQNWGGSFQTASVQQIDLTFTHIDFSYFLVCFLHCREKWDNHGSNIFKVKPTYFLFCVTGERRKIRKRLMSDWRAVQSSFKMTFCFVFFVFFYQGLGTIGFYMLYDQIFVTNLAKVELLYTIW